MSVDGNDWLKLYVTSFLHGNTAAVTVQFYCDTVVEIQKAD